MSKISLLQCKVIAEPPAVPDALSVRTREGLEENLQRKLQCTSFAREHRTKVVEDTALRFKGIARRTGNGLGSHRVGRSTERTGASTRRAAWNKLWIAVASKLFVGGPRIVLRPVVANAP